MPPLRRLGLPVELTAALARLAPPVLTLETLLARDVDALQRDTGGVSGKCKEGVEEQLAKKKGKGKCGNGGNADVMADDDLIC